MAHIAVADVCAAFGAQYFPHNMNEELVRLLVQRVKGAGAMSRLLDKLRDIKTEQQLPSTFS